MPILFDEYTVREALTRIGQEFHRRGWMAGTAGNLSARDAAHENSFWITASGHPKGQLVEDDFLRINIDDGKVVEQLKPTDKPSAETAIHRVLYKKYPTMNACFHVHSVDASIVSRSLPAQAVSLPLPPLEMLKGLGVWLQNPEVAMPLFDNLFDVQSIADTIEQRFTDQSPQIPALLIRDHGVTVWGDSLQEAYNRLEIAEFILSYMARC
jgi:methylthioribulose-1-phosphate dehydratase